MPKLGSLLIIPLLMLAMIAVWIIIPRLEPLKDNIATFRPWFDGFFIVFQVFFLYLSLLTILYNTGDTSINIGQFMTPGLALLFGYVGLLLPRTKRNWFVGIRTPWTLSSDAVWDKTHRLGGTLFVIAAIIMLIGTFFPAHLTWFILVPILAAALGAVGYSYVVFRQVG
jgi:uncharacterized membrane protein